MSKFDEQLSRMSYLMEYKMPKNEVKSNIEYHANGADGKVYGILKEGTKYYIKTTEMGKENLAESYNYINGINSKKENEYASYNDATKHLELQLMSLNEAYGKHEDVSTVDLNRGEKAMTMLTEAARTELDRMKQIFENSGTIGAPVVGKDNVHGSATDPKSQGAPFGEGSSEGSHEKGTSKTQSNASKANRDYTDASRSVESQMTSTRMPKGGKSIHDTEDAKSDLDGISVASEKKTGGKVVRVNEGLSTLAAAGLGSALVDEGDDGDIEEGSVGRAVGGAAGEVLGNMVLPGIGGDFGVVLGSNLGDAIGDSMTDECGNCVNNGNLGEEYNGDDISNMDSGEQMDLLYDGSGSDPVEDEPEGDLLGVDDEEDGETLSEMLERYDSLISGDDDSLTGPGTDKKGNAIATWERVDEDWTQDAKDGGDAIMDGEPNTANGQGGRKKAVATWERVEESIKREARRIMKECSFNQKETLSETIQRLVSEEVTRLNAWGKHPRFRKQPMTTPPNKEILAGTADRDWNDDSAKGEQPYGLKIGSSAPFDQKVEFLTDGVMAQLKESLGLKKK